MSETNSTGAKSLSGQPSSEGDRQGKEQEKISNAQLYSIMVLMLAFGTCNTVIMKMQDDTVVGTYSDGSPKKFTHPYFQCAVMFVGEFTCMIMYGMKRLCYPAPAQDGPSMNPMWIAIPAIFDICGSSLMFVALTMTAASIY